MVVLTIGVGIMGIYVFGIGGQRGSDGDTQYLEDNWYGTVTAHNASDFPYGYQLEPWEFSHNLGNIVINNDNSSYHEIIISDQVRITSVTIHSTSNREFWFGFREWGYTRLVLNTANTLGTSFNRQFDVNNFNATAWFMRAHPSGTTTITNPSINFTGYRKIANNPPPEVQPNEVLIEFRNPDSTMISQHVVLQNQSLSEDILRTPFNGFIPTHRRFSHWQSRQGDRLNNFIPRNNAIFYPVMISDFTVGTNRIGVGEPRPDRDGVPVFLNSGQNAYSNEYIQSLFTDRGFQPAVRPGESDVYMQMRRDPVLVSSINIYNFNFAYDRAPTRNWRFGSYFEITFNTFSGAFISSRLEFENHNFTLRLFLDMEEGNVRLQLGRFDNGRIRNWNTLGNPIPLNGGSERWWTRGGSGDRGHVNSLRFDLDVMPDGMIAYHLQWGRLAPSGASSNPNRIIGDANRYRRGYLGYDGQPLRATALCSVRQNEFSLGLQGIQVFPFNGTHIDHLDGWRTWTTDHWRGDKAARARERLFEYFPTIHFYGVLAETLSQRSLYLEDEFLQYYDFLESGFNRPNLHSSIAREGYTIRWYIDRNFQTRHDRHHRGQDFYNLYGRWVPAEFEVALSFFELFRRPMTVYGISMEFLVRRTEYRWFRENEYVDTKQFGMYLQGIQYLVPFYDIIPSFNFIGWRDEEGNLLNPEEIASTQVTANMHFVAEYRLPRVQVRYFDINNHYFGSVWQDMFFAPIDELFNQLQYIRNQANQGAETGVRPSIPNVGLFGIFDLVQIVEEILYARQINANIRDRNLARRQAYQLVYELVPLSTPDNRIFIPTIRLDINLEDLDNGRHGNAAFVACPTANAGWRLMSGTPQQNNLIYFVDLHSYFSLNTNHRFVFTVNFQRPVDVWELIFGGIMRFFQSLSFMFGGLNLLWILAIILLIFLMIFCWPVVVMTVKALGNIITFPIRWLGKKTAGGAT